MYKHSNDINAVVVNIVIIIVVGLLSRIIVDCARGKFEFIFMICWRVRWWLAFHNNNIDSDTDINSNGQCSSAFNIVYEHPANNDENTISRTKLPMCSRLSASVYRPSVIQP